MARPLTVESIKTDLETLNRKIERLTEQLSKAQHLRDALETVLRVYSDQPKRSSSAQKFLAEHVDALKGMTAEQALVQIAKKNDGELNSTISRKVLEAAGILTGENTENDLWTILKASKHFKKLEGRGRYCLVSHS